jgi:hypothetical protein
MLAIYPPPLRRAMGGNMVNKESVGQILKFQFFKSLIQIFSVLLYG